MAIIVSNSTERVNTVEQRISKILATCATAGTILAMTLTSIPPAQAVDMNISAPTNAAIAPASNTDTSVVLTWDKPANYPQVSQYNIYLGDILVGTTDMTYYKVTGLTPSTAYNFTVRAVGSDGSVRSATSNVAAVTTTATPTRYNVRDYGATGDGTTKDTQAIQQAIDACNEKNCEVYLPQGVYLSGALNLHSDMTFYVDANAQLKPSTDLEDYPFTSARHDIEDILGINPAYSSLLNAGEMDKNKGITTENIKIMGSGTIGDADNGLLPRKAYDDVTNEGAGMDHDLPGVYQKDQHIGGGSLISMKNVGGIYMDSVHIRNGMMWTIVPVYSKDITVYGLDLVTSVHNGDGFDPNSSTNVWTLSTQFSTGDDCSAIKSGKDAEGIAINRPSDHLYYRGDVFNSGHGGVTIGSEMSGGISDVFVEDSTIVPVDLTKGTVNPGIRVKVSPKRSAYVRNVQVRDSVINQISVITNYDKTSASGLAPSLALPDIENFRFSNIVAPNWNNNNGKGNIIDISGSNFGDGLVKYLKNFQFDDCKFYAAQLDTTQNIAFRNTELYQGLSATRSVNVTQDGSVEKDKSFPVNDDFEHYAGSTSLPPYWRVQKSTSGGGTSFEQGEDGNTYLLLTDNGPGYETLQRTFTSQKDMVHAAFAFMLPQTGSVGNNTVIDWQDASTNKPAARFTTAGNGDELKFGGETVLKGIEAGRWYVIGTDFDIADQQLSVSVDGDKVLSDVGFSDKKATGIGLLETHLNNNNKEQARIAFDDIEVTAESADEEAMVSAITVNAASPSIDTKDGTLQMSAAVEANNDSVDRSVTWSVTKPDMTTTTAATIDANGLLTAHGNGTVLAVATANDGSQTMGIYPVIISNQQTVTGLIPVSLLTTVGTVPVLPEYVYQTNSDGTTMPVAVTWDKVKESDYLREGTFTVTGTVKDVGAVQAMVTVTSVSIKDIEPSVVKTTPGKLKLPISVIANLNDGTKQRLSVVWDGVDQQQYASEKLDGFELERTVSGTELKAKATVIVLPVIVEGVTPIVVSQDGKGDYKTVGEALQSIPHDSNQRRVIFVKRGTYKEKLVIDRAYVTIIGESPDSTVVTYDDKPSDIGPDGKELGTYKDYSVKITGHDFSAKNITFQTTAGSTVGQAVALDISADHASFENCHILGYQDTLLLRNRTDESETDNVPNQPTLQTYRSYFKGCFISGSVDWIFGAAQAVFDESTIHAMLNGYVTAASTPKGQKYGFVFLNSTVAGENPYSGQLATYLGRPWRPYANVVYLNTTMDRNVPAAGWDNWGNSDNEKTVRYVECNSSGDGYDADGRVDWVQQTCDPDEYTLANIFSADSGINVDGDWDPTQLINPEAAPQTPIAVDANVTTTQSVAVAGDLSPYAQAEDADALTFEAVNQPEHGVLTLSEDGAYSYLPDPSYSGNDEFTFKALNGSVESNEALVSVEVQPATINPDANPVILAITEDADGYAMLTQEALAGITDANGNILFDLGQATVNVPFVYARMLMGYDHDLRLSSPAVSAEDTSTIDTSLGDDLTNRAKLSVKVETVSSDGKATEITDLPGIVKVVIRLMNAKSIEGSVNSLSTVYHLDGSKLIDLGGGIDSYGDTATFHTRQTGVFTVVQSRQRDDNSGGSDGDDNGGDADNGGDTGEGSSDQNHGGSHTSGSNSQTVPSRNSGHGHLNKTGSAVVVIGFVAVASLGFASASWVAKRRRLLG